MKAIPTPVKLLAALVLAASATHFAQAQEATVSAPAAPVVNPRPNADYIPLEPPQPTRVPAGKIELIEFFNFSCPHCFRMQGPFAKWRNETELSDVVVVRHPVVFRTYNGHFARFYYTLEALGLGEDEKFLGKVYSAIHRQRRLINSRDRALDWLEEEGVDRDKAEAAYDSFGVNVKVRRAEAALENYGVDSTPQFVVNGKYRLAANISGSRQRMLAIAKALIERERELIASDPATKAAADKKSQ